MLEMVSARYNKIDGMPESWPIKAELPHLCLTYSETLLFLE